MKFKIPDGFAIPPDVDEGGEFNVVALLKDNKDGTVTLLDIDGAKLKGGGDSDDKPKEAGVFGRAKAAGYKMKGEP